MPKSVADEIGALARLRTAMREAEEARSRKDPPELPPYPTQNALNDRVTQTAINERDRATCALLGLSTQ